MNFRAGFYLHLLLTKNDCLTTIKTDGSTHYCCSLCDSLTILRAYYDTV